MQPLSSDELELWRNLEVMAGAESVLDFIPLLSPQFTKPNHLRPLAEAIARSLHEPVRMTVAIPPRHSKALADNTPMLTKRGWVTVRDVVVGDYLVGSDGGWTEVLGVFPQGSVDLYRVKFSCGASIVACAEHRWSVTQRYGCAARVKTTAELAVDLAEADGRKKWKIPMVKPWVGFANDLPIDPYLFGCWLGDGSSYKAEITSMDPEIVAAIGDAGYQTSYEYPAGRAKTYGILGLQPTLKALGVLKDKHVPDIYLNARPEQRLAVIQGLCDTDGTVASNGSFQSYCTTSPRLARAFKILVSSLGGKWTCHERPAAKKTAYQFQFRLPEGVAGFRLSRKQDRLHAPNANNKPRRFISTIVPEGSGHATCFTVAAPDHLFAAGEDFIITHNTETIIHSMAWRLSFRPQDTLAYISYAADIARSKSRRARDLAREAGVQIRQDSAALNEWRTVEGGGVLATGVGGPLTGQGANVLIIDDPIKNREEAESGTIRDKLWDWWCSTAVTRVEPGGSVFVIQCIAENEPVLMGNGTWKSVQDVRPGDYVAAWQDGEYVSRRVTNFKNSGQDVILKIETNTRHTRLNAKHPLMLESGEWREAGKLVEGDKIHIVNKSFGTESVDLDFAWLFGYMMGDGWVTTWERSNLDKKRGKKYNSRSWAVCVAQCIRPSLNEKVIRLIEKFYGRKPKETKFGYVRLDSNSAGRDLIEKGLTGGAHGKRIPEWVFRLNVEGKLAFLSGYTQADGHKQAKCKDSWRVASVSRDLIEDTRRLSISAAVHCNPVRSSTRTNRAPHSKEAKETTCYSVCINFAKLVQAVETVKKVSLDGVDTVYDLTVEGAENFNSNGILCHNTRWHDDDLIGRLQQEEGWTHLNLPAIDENVVPPTALWPERWSLDALQTRRREVGEYDWSALYQGQPRPKGGRLFNDPLFYDDSFVTDGSAEPTRIVIGVDPAATAKTTADYSVAVVMAQRGQPGTTSFRVDILDVFRAQIEIPKLVNYLAHLNQKWRAPLAIEAVGAFKVVPQMLRAIDKNIRIFEISPVNDKFTRALPVSAAWNDGRVRLPRQAPWLKEFLTEVTRFTGVKDAHDDCVDAMAYAFNAGVELIPAVRGRGTFKPV